jgi:hypothetical protein
VLADYLCERVENVEHFFRTGAFDFFADADESADDLSDDERLDALSDTAEHPFLSHSEVNDHDWMELAWTLRYQQPEIFREVLLILRARARAEEAAAAAVAPQSAAGGEPPAGLPKKSRRSSRRAPAA